jgi:excisionase family DNA binding protein
MSHFMQHRTKEKEERYGHYHLDRRSGRGGGTGLLGREIRGGAGRMNAFTVKSLAERWQCSTDQIYLMIRRKELKVFRLGRDIRISAEEVARYENQ